MINTAYRCEICGIESQNPSRWVAIQCSNSHLTIYKWSQQVADAPEILHYCGESHAQVYISRWLEAHCG
jgi:hypothetical protein